MAWSSRSYVEKPANAPLESDTMYCLFGTVR